MSRVLQYLAGPKNLIGCGLALVGLVLHLFGLFGPLWPIVVVGLYAVGVLLGPRRRVKVAAERFDPQRVREALDRAYAMTHGRLPVDVQSRVARIRQGIYELLPRAADFPVGSQDLFVLTRMATDYLPTTLQAYLALPPDYAMHEVVRDGKTSFQVMNEQLALLDEKLDEIADAVHRRDSDRLLIQGRFLEERFGQGDRQLSVPPETRTG